MAKYDPLTRYLKSKSVETLSVTMTFDEIANLCGELPKSAWEHRPRWANDATHSQAQAWIFANWEVSDVNQATEVVMFRRVK